MKISTWLKIKKEEREKRKLEKLLASDPKLREIVELMKKDDDLDESFFPDKFAERVAELIPQENIDLSLCK